MNVLVSASSLLYACALLADTTTITTVVCYRAYEKAEDGVHYCEERFLDVARRFGVLGLPARHVPLEDALKAHASQARACCACTECFFSPLPSRGATLCSLPVLGNRF